MEKIFQTLAEYVLPIIAIVVMSRLMFKVYRKVFRGTAIGDVFDKADKSAREIAESYKESRYQKKREKRQKKIDKGETSEHVQVKFGKNHSKMNSKPKIATSKYNWDLPNVNDIGKDELLAKDHGKSGLGRIKTFEEFVEASKEADVVLSNSIINKVKRTGLPDMLRLELPNGDQITCDPVKNQFYLNDKLMGASIENVYGLRFLQNSRIDGMPIVQIRSKGKDPILVKVNRTTGQFELVKNHVDQHIRPDFEPQKSNIDNWWKGGLNKSAYGLNIETARKKGYRG